MSERHKGEKAYNWIKDRSLLKKAGNRRSSAYNNWVFEIKKRDNFKCKINNKDCCGKIVAHHILSWRDFPELRYNINNGITLCQSHHPRKWDEEKRLMPVFQELVPVSNEII